MLYENDILDVMGYVSDLYEQKGVSNDAYRYIQIVLDRCVHIVRERGDKVGETDDVVGICD